MKGLVGKEKQELMHWRLVSLLRKNGVLVQGGEPKMTAYNGARVLDSIVHTGAYVETLATGGKKLLARIKHIVEVETTHEPEGVLIVDLFDVGPLVDGARALTNAKEGVALTRHTVQHVYVVSTPTEKLWLTSGKEVAGKLWA